MTKRMEMELKVGIFVVVGIALVMLAILILGSTENLLDHKDRYYSHFNDVEGLVTGAKVVIGGVQVGTVDTVDFDSDRRDIKLTLQIIRKSEAWIRQDSGAEIATQGVLGDKYIIITAGNPDQPPLAPGSEIPRRPSKDLTQFLSKGDQLMVSLNNLAVTLNRTLKPFDEGNRNEIFFQGLSSSAKNLALLTERLNHEMSDLHLKTTVTTLNSILEKINNGTGTLGALVNDPELYDNVKSLVGSANRNRIMRNLVRQTIRESEEQNADSAKAPKKK